MKLEIATEDAIEYFGGRDNKGVSKLAEALGCTTNAIYQWPDQVPESAAYKLYWVTEGQIKANVANAA